MLYPGYCAKYGSGTMFALGLAFGTAAGIGVEAALHGIEQAGHGGFSGYMGGALGMVAGAATHWFADDYCSKHKMGITKGGALTKKMQLAVYSAMLTGAIAFHQIDIFDKHKVDVPEADQQTTLQINHASKTLEATLVTHGLRLAA